MDGVYGTFLLYMVTVLKVIVKMHSCLWRGPAADYSYPPRSSLCFIKLRKMKVPKYRSLDFPALHLVPLHEAMPRAHEGCSPGNWQPFADTPMVGVLVDTKPDLKPNPSEDGEPVLKGAKGRTSLFC